MTLSGKLIVFVLCAFVGCMAGLLCARRICEKENYYKELSNFCSHFKSCVAFRNDEIANVINGFPCRSTLLKSQLYAKANATNEYDQGFLNTEEYSVVSDFLYNLGRFDEQTQIEDVMRNKEIFEDNYKSLKEKNAVKRPMYIKLGLLFGALVGVLTM